MSFYQYHCEDCNKDFELKIGLLEGKYILYFELTKQEEDAMWEKGIDPRDHTPEIVMDEIPETPICSLCGSSKTSRLLPNVEGKVSGRAMTYSESKRFVIDGYNKQQAMQFYKDSIQASKERMADMGEVYKKVSPNMEYMCKTGKAKPAANRSARVESLRKANAEIRKPLDKLGKK